MTETPALSDERIKQLVTECNATIQRLHGSLLHYDLVAALAELQSRRSPNPSLAPVSEKGQVDDSSLTVADPNAAPSVGDMERIKEHAHIVFSGCEDYPDKRRQSKYADWTWEQLKEKFHGSAVALLAYMEQRGYRIGRECAFHDYLFANGLKVGDGAIVPVDGSEITSPANGATEDATKVREPSSSQAALKGGRRDGD